MTWWGWLLLGALAISTIFLLVEHYLKKKDPVGLSPSEKRDLLRIETEDLSTRLQAAEDAKKRLEQQVSLHEKSRKKLRNQLTAIKESIDAKKRAHIDNLLTDDTTLDDELDRLAGIE